MWHVPGVQISEAKLTLLDKRIYPNHLIRFSCLKTVFEHSTSQCDWQTLKHK
jgi:hypothetical protein